MPRRQKRKQARDDEPANLKRFRADIKKLMGNPDRPVTPAATDEKSTATLPRKQRRKDARKLKKLRRNAFHHGEQVPTAEGLAAKRWQEEQKNEQRRKKAAKKQRRRQRKRLANKEQQEEELEVKKQHDTANQADDKVIKELEKQLHLNKRKKKGTLPASFKEDGLDYILDAVDSEKLQALQEGEEELDEDLELLVSSATDSDVSTSEDSVLDDQIESEDDDLDQFYNDPESDDQDLDEGSKKIKVIEEILGAAKESKSALKSLKKAAESKKKSVKFAEEQEKSGDESGDDFDKDEDEDDQSSDEDEEMRCFEMKEDEESVDEEDEKEDAGDEEDDAIEDKEHGDSEDEEDNDGDSGDVEEVGEKGDSETQKDQLKEDIYGRLRDKSGNVVASQPSTYVPPGRRLQLAASHKEKEKLELERLQKQLKGLINRLSEANLASISNQIEELYRTHSRAHVSESLTSVVMAASIAPSLIPERLITEQALLIALLHNNVALEVGAVFLQRLAQKFSELQREPAYGSGKEMDNVLVLLAHLYNFRVVHCLLVFDVLSELLEPFRERDIELLLRLMKSVGFSLRKDDPVRLKDMIVTIQSKAASVDTSQFEDQSRVRFMLDILMAIRNNNMRKIPNYDPSHVEHLRKVLRNGCRASSSSDSQLRISIHDLLRAEEKGRWWLVGSAWAGNEQPSSLTASTTSTALSEGFSQQVLELARQQRMNTDIRRNIFCIIMTAEDYVAAFEKLLRLGLKQQPEREIMHVIVDMCMQEKTFNLYYAFLAQKFCEYHRRFMMTLQFCVWDKVKVMSEMAPFNLRNLGHLLAHLIATKALSLSVFKVMEFSEMGKPQIVFLRRAMIHLLLEVPENTTQEAFSRVAALPKLAVLREGLKLFMRHFLLRKADKLNESGALKFRVQLAEQSLDSAQDAVLL